MPYKNDLVSVYIRLCELLGEPVESSIETFDENHLFEVIEKQFVKLQSEFVSYKDQLEESSIMLETQVEEISKTYEEISTLYEVTSLLSKTLNPAEVLQKLMELILNSVPSAYIGIFLSLESGDVFETRQKGKPFSEEQTATIRDFFKRTMQQRQSKTVIIEEEGIKKRFPVFSGFLRSMITVPLGTENKLWGVLGLANKENGDLYTAGDRKLLESIGNQIYFGLENYSFLQERIRQERFYEQIEIARKIQESLLPQKIPQLDRLEVACHFEPAIEVAGDYYDVVYHNDKVFLVIADVSGKGVPASLLMSSFRSTVRIFLNVTDTLPELVQKVNDHIAQNDIADRFITGFFVSLNLADGMMRYVNAGHDPLILYRPEEERFYEITSNGIPTGIFEGETYQESYFQLKSGDVFILYTDGIPEARNPQREEFGFERMRTVIRENYVKSASEISKMLTSSLEQFSEAAPQHDDITFMILKYKG